MKNKIVMSGCFIGCFLMGMILMRVWDVRSAMLQPPPSILESAVDSIDPLESMDLEQATEPEGVIALDKPEELQVATESQLAPIHMPEIQTVISRSGKTYTAEENADSAQQAVSLGDAKYNTAPVAQPGGQEPASSNIVMIAAPVEPVLIKNVEQYKDFKRRARGSYPVANFSKENVLVLESTSNLPDKVFEIQQVEEKDGHLLVTYRVNVFGLDQKTNTHSAVLIGKRDLPIELKQVL